MILLIEFALSALAVAVACFFPNLGATWFAKAEQPFAALARRGPLAVVSVGLLALSLRAAMLPIEPIPVPTVHDEFSYLLMADTFAQGRMTNPPHSMWEHFESFHIIQQPTYASMYYPAQGIFLAVGQVIFGHPFWGVWLSAGLMCAATCWMLQGWLPPIWALFGGVLAAIRLSSFSYWADSYWGGPAAAIGGALILGALPRIKRYQRPRDAGLMGLGFAMLANSRPFEGLFFSLPAAAALIAWIVRRERCRPGVLTRVALPLGVMFLLTAGAMSFYFWRTTGNPLRPAYMVDLATYNPVPYFPWQSVSKNVPVFHHAAMKNFYMGWWLEQYEMGRSHPVILAMVKVTQFWLFFLGPLLSVPLVALAVSAPVNLKLASIPRRARFLLLVCGVTAIGMMLPVFFDAHYAAPLTAAIYALVIMALQRIRRERWRGGRAGLAIVRSILLLAIVMLFVRIASPALERPLGTVPLPPTWYSSTPQLHDRANLEKQLKGQEGSHLVVVRYSPKHDPRNEWVYNQADIDNARVVWAREMSAEQNERLIHYFKDRKVWLVQPDEVPVQLTPYSAAP